MTALSEPEIHLLQWLGQEDYSQYGECYGKDLDRLVSEGLAQVHEDRALQSGFIAQGDGPMFRAVSLTDAGVRMLKTLTSFLAP